MVLLTVLLALGAVSEMEGWMVSPNWVRPKTWPAMVMVAERALVEVVGAAE